MKRRAIIAVDLDLLRKQLQLPDGVKITRISAPIDQPNMVEMLIDGAGWWHDDRRFVQRAATATIEDTPDGLVINWNIPDGVSNG